MLLDIRPDHLKIVQDILQKCVPEHEVWAFGSRAKWLAKEYSDLDLCILGKTPLSFRTLGLLEEAFEDSDLPYKVDVVDWATTSESFRQIIERDKVVVPKGGWGMSSEWQSVRLGDVASFKTGKLDSNAAEEGGYYPFFTCSPNTLAINSFAFDTDAVILAGNNANGVFSCKHYAGKFNAYQRTYVIEPISKAVTSCRYLFFVISHQINHLKELSVGSATKFLTKTILVNLPVVLPRIEEQERIAELLSLLDDRITLLRETNATLEAIAQALFKSWFVDFDPVHAKQQGRAPEGMDDATAALFPDSFEESALGLVPKGWGVGTLGDVAQTARQQLQVSDLHADLHYVGLEHIPRKSLSLTTWGNAEGLESAKAAFSEGDILFGKLRPYFHKVVIAPFSGVCSTDILACQPRATEYFGVVAMHLFSETLIEYADRLSNGAKMPRVNWKDLAAYPICIPPKEVAAELNEAIRPLVARMNANTHQAQTLATLRDTLLPRLISGQLRLPEAETAIEEIA